MQPRKSTSKLKSQSLICALALSAIAGSASPAFAATCTYNVTAVQSEANGKVLVQFDNNTWHVAADDTQPSRSDRLSVVMAAYLSGKKLYMSFVGSSCTTNDYSTVATKVRVTN